MKIFKADYVYPVCAEPIKNGIVTVDDQGRIISVIDPISVTAPFDAPVEQLNGIICPGFVNAHCHLELSHLKNKLPRKTGLVEFIIGVQKFRDADKGEITDAAAKADEEMYNNGIVAVGDISNNIVTIAIKQKSKLYYHNFVECFGFLPEKATEVFNKTLEVVNAFKPMPASLVPHAPYSVSKELFRMIRDFNETGHNLVSMHNQESEDENKFYRYKLGTFNDLYAHFGMDISYFKPQARNSIQSIVPLLTDNQKILLVHNTFTNLKDIYFIKRFDRDINWCFCPNANLYIENKLPKVELFAGQGYDRITLGTDSLASNSGLSILSEMITLQKSFPSLSTAHLIQWGTQNGAKFLGIADEKGTIEPGKVPGLNLITNMDGDSFTAESRVRKLC